MFETVVETTSGKVRGERVGGISVWKGILFAKPPLGNLRFRPPVDPEPWAGVRDATKFGPSAMQPVYSSLNPDTKNQATSEDCLYLNIWSPNAADRLRPVMVWIHGGGFLVGSGSEPLYDGVSFVTQGDVVVVTINYRLGAFGFLYLGAVGGDKYATSGNCGLLDQIAALRWVRENIRVFGGDPNRVTVFGESAGAISIGNLLAMPEAKGLFNQAALSSTTELAIRSDQAAHVTNKLMASLHLKPSEFEKLVEIPAKDLLKASKVFPMMTFSPVTDGITIPERPVELLSKGSAKDIPILIGANRDEFQLFSVIDPTFSEWDEAEVSQRLEQIFNPLWPECSKRFSNQPMDQAFFNRIMSYYSLVYPTLKTTEALSIHSPVWAYLFNFEHPVFGAGHGYDLPFVWHNFYQSDIFIVDTPEGQRLADQMHHAWIAFARQGDPNTLELPDWPRFDLENRAVMVFDAESRVKHDPYLDRIKWEEICSLIGFQPLTHKLVEWEGDLQGILNLDMAGEIEEQVETREMHFREGYFSIKDNIEDIMNNEQGAELLMKIYAQVGSDGNYGVKVNKVLMKMLQKLSIERIAELAGNRFPRSALYEINEALNQIKK